VADHTAPARPAPRAVASTGGVRDRAASTDRRVRLAAVSFVSGLVGLLVANLLLGPLAIVLGLTALRKEPDRRGRAMLGVVLGVADIALFILLAARAGAHHGSLSWNFLSR